MKPEHLQQIKYQLPSGFSFCSHECEFDYLINKSFHNRTTDPHVWNTPDPLLLLQKPEVIWLESLKEAGPMWRSVGQAMHENNCAQYKDVTWAQCVVYGMMLRSFNQHNKWPNEPVSPLEILLIAPNQQLVLRQTTTKKETRSVSIRIFKERWRRYIHAVGFCSLQAESKCVKIVLV